MSTKNELDRKALAGHHAAVTQLVERLELAERIINDSTEALREFVEYNADAEGDVALGDCDRVWNKAEAALKEAREYLTVAQNGSSSR